MADFATGIKADNIFRVSLSQLDEVFTVLEKDITAEIQRMRALGIGDDEIFSRVSDSLNNGVGFSQRFKGGLEREVDTLLGVTAQAESNEILSGVEGALMWTLDPTVKEHCDTCLENADKPAMSFEKWAELGLPGFGNTDCGQYCRCSLEIA